MLTKRIVLIFIWCFLNMIFVDAQELVRCGEREFLPIYPRISTLHWCPELPFPVDASDAQTFTSLAIDDDGKIYGTHPYRGQVVVLTDNDGDNLPDTETVIAENLAYPHGIELYDNTLYVLGDGVIYTIADNEVITLVDDLPAGRGFLARAILIHEEKMYIGVPSPCDFCVGDDPLHGTVIRVDLDGNNREIIAHGLRYPTALEFYEGALWVTDVARDIYNIDTYYDEINRIDLTDNTVPHFGFPYCVGADNTPDLIAEFDCANARAPYFTLQTHSTPMALTYYYSETLAHVTGDLLVALFGSAQSNYIAGHAFFAIEINSDGYRYSMIAPADEAATVLPTRWQAETPFDITLRQAEFVNNQAGGIFPHHPYDIVVSPEGYIYFSVGGKGVYVLRPL